MCAVFHTFLIVPCLLALPSSLGFLTPHRAFRHHPPHVLKEPWVAEETSAKEKDASLSDVDARVLRSMLNDSKLDLDTEEDVRKLLERGTHKTMPTPNGAKASQENSVYSSTALKTLSDTTLWKKLSAQASDILESFGIWVSNKVEQDMKVLAALGLFAWDRVVRDVARALPEATSQAKKTMLFLTNSSSFEADASEQPSERSIRDEMNRPSDEIKTVSREILGILSGQQRSSNGRRLRTAAPAGFNNAGERQRRAYYQSRKIDRQEKDVTRMAGNVVDSAWELRRELSAETNKPGYKTEPIRNAIEAGVVGTGNLLKSVREEARLAAARRKEEKAWMLAPTSSRQDLLAAMKEEERRVSKQLRRCIEAPSRSWMKNISREAGSFDQERLTDVVTMMVLLQNEITSLDISEDEESAFEVFQRLQYIRRKMEEIQRQAAESLTDSVASTLRQELFGINKFTDEPPLIVKLEGLSSPTQLLGEPRVSHEQPKIDERKESNAAREKVGVRDDQGGFGKPPTFIPTQPPVVEILDVVPETVVVPESVTEPTRSSGRSAHIHVNGGGEVKIDVMEQMSPGDVRYNGVVAEVVSDDDFDKAVGFTEVSKTVKEDFDDGEEEENVAITIALRSLDVVFFVMEKFVISGIPLALVISMTVLQRLSAVNEMGKGRSGWQQFQKLSNSEGRY